VNFYLMIRYKNEKAFNNLSEGTRIKLHKWLPEDLEQTPEIRAASKLEKFFIIDAVFGKNILTCLNIGKKSYSGYLFYIVGGVAQTSLTAMQYSEAQNLVAKYYRSPDPELLNLICAILYQVCYNEQKVRDLARIFADLSELQKQAVLVNFCAISSFIIKKTKYSILFDRPKQTATVKKHTDFYLGLAENIYQLSKRGYGNTELMENANLFKFFDIMIKEMADTACELKHSGKKPGEIAEIMNLSIEQLNKLL